MLNIKHRNTYSNLTFLLAQHNTKIISLIFLMIFSIIEQCYFYTVITIFRLYFYIVRICLQKQRGCHNSYKILKCKLIVIKMEIPIVTKLKSI